MKNGLSLAITLSVAGKLREIVNKLLHSECGVSILLYSVIIIFCVPTKFYCIPIRPVC